MRTLLALVFLFCAAPLFAANPSLFVPWTAILGSNGVTVVTNPASGRVIISGTGGGDSIWTNNAGVIQPVSTNEFFIYPNGALVIDTNSTFWDTPDAGTVLMGYREGTASLKVGAIDGVGDWTMAFGANAATATLTFQLLANSVTVTDFSPTAADGSTPYTFDTSVEQGSAPLMRLANVAQTRFKLSPLGGLAMGTTNVGSATIDASYDGSLAMGQAQGVDAGISAGGVGGMAAGKALEGAYIEAGTSSMAFGVANGDGNFGSAFLSASPATIGGAFVFGTATNGSISATGQGSLAGGVALDGVVSADGFAGFTWGENVGNSGNNAYAFGKQFTNSTANTFNVGWGAAHFIVNPTNGVSTPLITAYGAVAQPWQLGSASNVVSVAFPGFTATNIIEVAINGVAYYIPAKIK